MNFRDSDLPAHLRERLGVAPRNKYGVSRKDQRTADGITFDSKAEMHHYRHLCAMKVAGIVKYFLMQVPFTLPGNTKYRVDFMVVFHDGRIEFQDVKGMRTKEFIRAKKQTEALYPVDIREIRAKR